MLLNPSEDRVPPSVTTVRLSTSYWSDARGIHCKKSITVLKRKSTGPLFFLEDVGMVGAEDVMRQIVNLDECEDGEYTVNMCDIERDWETGWVDGWNYRLDPVGPIQPDGTCQYCGRDYTPYMDDPDLTVGGPCPSDDCPSNVEMKGKTWKG